MTTDKFTGNLLDKSSDNLLFAWQPKGHGEYSFFVMAENEEKARKAVAKFIATLKESDKMYSDGWETDYYKLTVVGPESVVINCNE